MIQKSGPASIVNVPVESRYSERFDYQYDFLHSECLCTSKQHSMTGMSEYHNQLLETEVVPIIEA